jgi:hypothetical protein
VRCLEFAAERPSRYKVLFERRDLIGVGSEANRLIRIESTPERCPVQAGRRRRSRRHRAARHSPIRASASLDG